MTTHNFQFIRISNERGITTLTLARPQVRNALNHAMMEEIGEAISLISKNASTRVLVIRGQGGHFCAGGDLNAMADPPSAPAAGDDPTFRTYRSFGDVLEAVDGLPFAVVCVVEGTCVGGGAGMAAASDIVIAADNARFGLPKPRHGFIPSQVIPALVRRIGLGATRRIAVAAEVIDAAEAHRLGLADRVVPASEVDAALTSLLRQLRRNAPRAVAAVKALVLSAADRSTTEVLDQGAHALLSLLRGPEAKEGIAAFLSKRAPGWDV